MKFKINEMKSQLKPQLQSICKKCHSVRKELKFGELPEEMKKEIRKLKHYSLKFFNYEKYREIIISFQNARFK